MSLCVVQQCYPLCPHVNRVLSFFVVFSVSSSTSKASICISYVNLFTGENQMHTQPLMLMLMLPVKRKKLLHIRFKIILFFLECGSR